MAVATRSKGIGLVFGGTAKVHCVHDREKNQVKTEDDIAAIGLTAGFVYNKKLHKIHLCSCCNNLFVDETDIPKYCHQCRTPPFHKVMAPIAPPRGVVS